MKEYLLKWASPDGRYNIVLMQRAWENIVHFYEKTLHRETGGILIGYYTDDLTTAIVTEITHPSLDSGSGYTWFYRGIVGLKQLLIHRWKEPERRYYLGEWHYHPAKYVEPSIDDINQMAKISRDKNYSCREPIMLIIGYGYNTNRQVRAFIFPRGKPMVELSLIN